MRAVMCEAFGPPSTLTVRDVPDLVPGKGDVRIAIEACGVNFPDTLIIEGKYQFKPDLPFSPGGEVSGVVDMLGEGVVGVALGDRMYRALIGRWNEHTPEPRHLRMVEEVPTELVGQVMTTNGPVTVVQAVAAGGCPIVPELF